MQLVQRLAAMTKQVQGEEEKKVSSIHLVQQQEEEEEEKEEEEYRSRGAARAGAAAAAGACGDDGTADCTTDETKSLGSTVRPHHALVFSFFPSPVAFFHQLEILGLFPTPSPQEEINLGHHFLHHYPGQRETSFLPTNTPCRMDEL
jgi:hypothetical protein